MLLYEAFKATWYELVRIQQLNLIKNSWTLYKIIISHKIIIYSFLIKLGLFFHIFLVMKGNIFFTAFVWKLGVLLASSKIQQVFHIITIHVLPLALFYHLLSFIYVGYLVDLSEINFWIFSDGRTLSSKKFHWH